MINLGNDASGESEKSALLQNPSDPVTFQDMCNDIGAAMPAARKAVKAEAPPMPRLVNKTYQEPHCDTASDWVAQLPLAMVATLIPSKQVHLYERKGLTGPQAIKLEYDKLEARGCWNLDEAEPPRIALSQAFRVR